MQRPTRGPCSTILVRLRQVFEITFEGETQVDIDPNGKESKKQPGSMVGVGIAIGIGVGTALGVTFDNIAIGIAIGAGVGVAIGAALDQQRKKEE